MPSYCPLLNSCHIFVIELWYKIKSEIVHKNRVSPVRIDDPSSTFMTGVYRHIRKGNSGVRKDLLRADMKDTSTVETNLGPCLAMGLVSWLVLYALYGLLS